MSELLLRTIVLRMSTVRSSRAGGRRSKAPHPAPLVPLLYATTGGHRYERFEIGNVEGLRWSAGVYAVTVRLFARGGKGVVKQEFAVWPAPEGN